MIKTKISELERTTEKIISCIGAFTYVNQSDLKAILPEKDIANNIRQLTHRKMISYKNIHGQKILCLTEAGYNLFNKYNNGIQELYCNDYETKDITIWQRHSRGRIIFMEGGANAESGADINDISRAPVYLDSWRIKELLGNTGSIKGSRATGLLVTPSEQFIVYCAEGGISKMDHNEDAFKSRILRDLLPEWRQTFNEVVAGTEIEQMQRVMYGREKRKEKTSSYIVSAMSRNVYFIPSDHARLQSALLMNKEVRDDKLGVVLTSSLPDIPESIRHISNRGFTKVGDRQITSFLDLNIGLIKDAIQASARGERITAVVLDDYADFFKQLTKGHIELVRASEKDLLGLIQND